MSEQSLYCETCCFLIERTNLAYWHKGDFQKQNRSIYVRFYLRRKLFGNAPKAVGDACGAL